MTTKAHTFPKQRSIFVKASLAVAFTYTLFTTYQWLSPSIDTSDLANFASHSRYLQGQKHKNFSRLTLTDEEELQIQNQSPQYFYDASKHAKCNDERIRGGPTAAGSFFPVFTGLVNTREPTFTMTDGNCFKRILFRYEETLDPSGEIAEIRIHIDPQEPVSKLCYEWLAIFTHQFNEFESLYLARPSVLTFRDLPIGTKHDVMVNGVRVYMFCGGYLDTLSSVWNFLKMTIGGMSPYSWLPIFGSHVPWYMERANVEFMRNTMHWNLQEREITYYDYDESNIQSGDVLVNFRLDGFYQLIMIGTGATVGHCTMALWMDGELYIIESVQNPFWPRAGVQKNKYRDWIQLARNSDYHVAHLPLTKEARSQFNATAAREFYEKSEGLAYGFHNFVFGWIDTEQLVPIIPRGGMTQAVGMLEAVSPSAANAFLTQALNKRLGTTGLTMSGLAIEAAKQNISAAQLMSLKEKDGWEYYGFEPRDGESYVCSSFVIAVMKTAGMFGDLEIQATEFTPRDLYELNFFDTNFKSTHTECQKADPDQPFCQIMGKYRMVLPNYGTIAPYNRMNENCPTIAPDFIRLENC